MGDLRASLVKSMFYSILVINLFQDVREEVYNEYFGAQKAVTRVLQRKSVTKAIGRA